MRYLLFLLLISSTALAQDAIPRDPFPCGTALLDLPKMPKDKSTWVRSFYRKRISKGEVHIEALRSDIRLRVNGAKEVRIRAGRKKSFPVRTLIDLKISGRWWTIHAPI